MNTLDKRNRALFERDQREMDEWRASLHAKEIYPGVFRNFCAECQRPILVIDPRLQYSFRVLCDGCPTVRHQPAVQRVVRRAEPASSTSKWWYRP